MTQSTSDDRSLPDILNPGDFAKLIGVKPEIIDVMYRNGKLPPISNRHSRKLRWYKQTVQFWLDNDEPDRDEFRRLWSEKTTKGTP